MKLKNCIFLLVFLCSAFVGRAGVIYVTNGSDALSGSLRLAINSAVSNDTIIINFKGGIALSDTVDIIGKNNLTIIGPYPKHNSFNVEGTNTQVIFNIANCSNISIKGLGFKHSVNATFDVRALQITNSSNIEIEDCVFEGCQPTNGNGGAVSVLNNSDVEFLNCSFIENGAASQGASGGAMAFDDSGNSAFIRNCTFYKNRADSLGGAIFIDTVFNTDERFVFFNNTFLENEADNSFNESGHAIWFDVIDGLLNLATLKPIAFANNIFSKNFNAGNLNQSQIYCPTAMVGNNWSIWGGGNYYHFSAGEPIINAFNGGNDFTGPDAGVNLGLRGNPSAADIITDGYGLKYFTITSQTSPLVDNGISNPGATNGFGLFIPFSADIAGNDCRRAPREMDGNNDATSVVDIGATESTLYRISGTSVLPSAWTVLLQSVNGSGTPSEVHYVEFDLGVGVTEVQVLPNAPAILRTIYIDGFSQDGSAIPGPSNVNGLTTDTLTPARNLPILRPNGSGGDSTSGVKLSAANSIVAGISIVGFNHNGIRVNSAATGAKIFGTTIGVVSNVTPTLATSLGDGNGRTGVYATTSDATIGGIYHHQRNVITGNGYDPDPGFATYFGTNIRVGNSASNIKIVGNVIGLHPNGKDVTVKDESNAANNGIFLGTAPNAEIGNPSLFGLNIIGNHNGNGIMQIGTGGGTIIDNNHIGVTFDGLDPAANNHGVYLLNDTSITIGNRIGNVISTNDSSGIRVINGQGIKILGNIIGGDKSLTSTTFGNHRGVYITGNSGSSATPIHIGVDDFFTESERNIIVNNDIGVYLSGAGVQEVPIGGNLIGVGHYDATSALPNTVGIKIDSGAHHNYIGYEPSTAQTNQINIISGNTDVGVWFDGESTNNNRVASNIIGGTKISASLNLQALGNGTGVRFSDIESGTSNAIGNENDPDLKLIIVGNENGVEITGSSGISVLNSNIGIDTNNTVLPNNFGISILNSDIIGIGGASTKSNRISGNDSIGISIADSKDIILEGNFIGTNKEGTSAIGNEIGIKIYRGSDILIGQTEPNVISGNEIGLMMDSTFSNVIRNNYFGLSADGTFKIPGSYFGILGDDLYGSNDFGVSTLGVLGRNHFASDSIDISILDSKLQKIANNVFGYENGGINLVGSATTGIGVRIRHSKKIRVGGPGTSAGNTFGNRRVGVFLQNADSVQIQHCNFGVDITGTNVDIDNNQRFGVGSRGNSSNNFIGPKNVFGGNRIGIGLASADSGNKIFGNYFGIDTLLSASNVFQNDTAIYLLNSSNNEIGFGGDSANQIINYIDGIVLLNTADSNVFINNYIGTTSNGVVGGNTGNGVVINGSFRNKFGSNNFADRNVISRNNANGVNILNGSSGNSILRNSIHNNNALGIDIGTGFIVSDMGETGLQDEIHTPIINSAFACVSTDFNVEIEANNLTISDTYYFDIYTSNGDTLDAVSYSGYGEGGKSVFFDTVVATATSETFIFDLTGAVSAGDTIVAIITNGTTGSSSEFGQFIAVSGAPVAPDTTFLNEICETGALGGSIEIDNSANSTFVYSVSFDGSPMESTSADVFLQDTLIPGTYNMEIDYGNGCTVTFGKTLETGGVFEIGDSPLDDTCGLDVGIVILNVINNSISGAVFNDTLFSLNNGTTFQQGNTFGNLTAGSYTPQIQLDVTKGTVSDLCLASNISTINVDEHLIPVADLEFTYNNFCSDVNGSVTSTPNFSDGAYSISFTPITSTVTLDTASGQISSAQNGDTYTLTYYYGTCMSTDVAVTPFNVVYPTITMDDFCVNNNSPIPTVTPTGGTFSLVQQPMSSPEIVAANGQIQTTFSSFTPGLYHVEYITSDANCPRTDTVIIEAFDIPVAMSYTTEGNLINMDLLDIDSISFCPNFVGIDSIGSAFMTTNWIEPDGTAIINNSYSVNFPADGDDSTYTLDYFYTQDFTGTNTTVTCQSDLDSLVVQINAIPVDPQLTSDTSYCEGESLSILDVQNDALVHNLRWSNNVSSATDSVLTTSTPHLYPVPTSDISNYNNFILSVYSRDSTGVDCYSDYDTTEISFHSNPAIPALTLNVGGSTVIANQTIEICPTSDDSLVDTNVGGGNSIFAVSGNAPQTTDILQLQSSGDFSPLTTELVSYHTSEIQTLALVPTTCYSDTDTVFIQTYAIPVDPELTSDTSYCEGESLSILDVQNDALVHNLRWSNNVSSATDSVLTTSTPHLYPVPTSDISNYNNFILSVYSRDSTGVDCYSDYDTTEISFHSNPAIPALTLNVGGSTVIANQTIEICPTSDDSLVDTNVGGGNSIFAVSGNAPQTTDILQLQSSGDFSPLTTELVSYHTSEIQTLALVPTTCYSDTDTVFIQTYAIPVDPELTSDTSYCEGESLSILDVQNDALVHNLRWSNNVSSATDSVLTTSTPHLYPVPTSDISNYNNFILSVYSRDSTGVDCYSDYDTTEISFHSNPAIPALTLNVGGSTVIANQTIEICPTSDDSLVDTNVGGGNSIFAVAGNAPQTTDILQLQSSGDFSPLTTELVSYHTSEIQTLALVPTTCYSDTDTVFIQTYAIPVDPELTSDTSYCEGESLSILDVQNDALVHNLRWSNNVSSATDSVLTTSTPHLYPVPTSDISNYNNFILSVYSRDSTGVDCYSDYDTTEISFHSNPAIPALTLNVGGSTVIANQTIEICPTSDDSLVDTNVGGGNSIFAVAGNAPQTTDILQLQSSGDFSPLTTELVSYHTSEIQTLALVPTTCYSDTDTVFIQTYAIPVDPELTSDTSYCEGESLSILDVQNDALVHNLRWSNNVSSATDSVLTTSTPHLYPVPTSDISNYNNFILSVYSRDSTGVDCYSDYDTTEISFHSNPAIPALTLNVGGSTVIANQTIEICPTSDDSLVDTNVGGGNSIFTVATNAPQTTDILQLQSSGDFSPLTTELVSYHTSEIQTLALVPTTCYSDTDTVFIQTYAIPVDPELTSDTSYCEGESLSILDVQNDALVHNLRWSNNVSSATDSVLTTSTPHLYPVPTSDISNYNNFILSVYSRDSTGVDCYSDYDTTEISFHSNPAIPALTLNVGGSTVIANQTIEICPTSDDSLVDTNVGGGNSIFTVATNAPQTTDILQLQSSGDFSPLTTELVSYHTSEIQTLALVPTTCYSDTDTVFIQTYAIPVDPELTSDTSYCEGESLSILDVQNDALVHNLRWSNNVSSATDSVLTTSTPHLYPVPTSDISNYNNFILSVYSRDSTGVDCYSDYDTTEISFHSNPAIPALTLNVGGSTVIANQTIEICPTSDDSLVDTNVGGGNSIFTVATNAPQTTDILQLQSSGDFSPLTTELVSYHTSEIQTLALVPTTCYSDTDTVFIQTYAIPVDPQLTSDTSYCEGESLSILDVQNDALVHNLRWSNNVSSATDSVLTTSTPHLYPVPTSDISNYNNFTLSVYSRDSTGVDCYSDYDTTEISFHSNPAIPALTLNVGGSTVIANQTIEICPTSDDSLVDTNVGGGNSIFAVSGNAPQTTDILQLQSSGDFSPLTTELVSYHTSEIQTLALVPTTCYSDTDTVFIQTYAIPVDPELTSDTSYCEGESLSILDVQNDALVHNLRWSNNVSSATDSVLTTSTPHLYPVPTIDISNYNNFTLSVYSRDSTGVDCYSDYDTTEISFHSNPAIPALTLNGTGPNLVNGSTYNICPTLPLEDSIVATVLSGSSVFIVNNIENVTSIVNIEAPDFVPGSLELVSYFTSEDITGSLVPITCRSNIDSIYINTLGLPIEPIILTDGVDLDEISFCSGDNINNVLTLNDNTNPVYWEQLGVIGSQNPDSIAYVFTIPGSFAPQTRIYIAYDTTGVDYAMNICASDADTVWISYGEREATPDVYSVNLADTSYCPESNLVDILTDNGFGFPVISDWFLGDTLGVPINVNTSQITPSWDFSADTILTYYAQKPAVGIGCPSYFGSIDIHFHTTPEIPAINFNGAENGYCPGTFVGLDTLTSDSLIYWYYTDPPSTVVANDSFDLNGINTTMGQSKELNYFFIDEHTCISDTAQFSIDFHNFAIEPFILSDTTYCLGDIDADSLRARNSLAAPLDSLFGTGSWYASNGVPISSGVSSNTFNLGVSPPQIVGDTSFLFNYIDTNGCVSVTDTITLTTFPIPGAPSILVTDSVFCDGEDITPLNEINGEPANWYLIVNNSPDLQLADNSTYTPADSGTYIATVIVNECESEADTVEIVIKPIPDAPIIADMQLQYCNDQIVDTINIQSSFKGTWYNGNDIVTAVATDTNSYLHTTPIVDSVVYLVNVLDPSTECYSDFDTVTLYQFVTVASISTELAEICLGFAQDLEAIGGVSYAWSTLDSVASISVAPNESTWYFVDIVDENDCKIRDSIEVILKLPSSCESQVYTAFSPNGDGVNETWEITGIELYENPVVYIFNRWGDKIATIKNYDNELNVWDGTNQLNGKAVVYGTYYYIIEDGTTKVKDGWLQVVK